jgi:Tol biopolymer transport system component
MAYDYAPGRNDQRDIFVARLDVARLDEGAPSALVATDASEVVLGWLPDGRHLMYLSNASGTIGAWIVRVTDGRADGEPVFVNGDLGRFEGLGFTADGRFYSEVLVGGSDVQSVPLDRRTGLASGEPKPLPGRQPGVRRAQGTWSATGDRLAFFRSAPMSPTALGIHDRATGRLETFPLPVWNLERPNWHPDGRRIVVVGRDGVNQACAFEVDLDSGSVTCITDRTPYAVYTPDGVYLIYRRPRSDDAPAVIVRRRLSDDNEEVIFTGPGGFVLSPNGERLLLYRGRAGQPDAQEATASLSVVPVSGGEPRVVLDRIADSVNEYAFSADGRYAYYVTGRTSDVMDIWRVAIDGSSPPEPLGVSLPMIDHLSANPDGSSLAVSGGVARFETWVWDKPANVVR